MVVEVRTKAMVYRQPLGRVWALWGIGVGA